MRVQPQILIVENEEALARASKEFLFSKGFGVKVALGGEGALRMLRAHPFDLLLLDINMPGVSGLHVLRAVRELQERTRVIVVSGNTSDAVLTRCRQEGVFNYLFKPVDPFHMLREVQRALDLGQ